MKNKKLFVFVCILISAFFLTSCGVLLRNVRQNLEAEMHEASTQIGENGELLETRFFGTYTVPAGWVALPEKSSDEKWFYTKEGIDFSSPTSNISVECGTNRYKAADHFVFKDSILKQLLWQASGSASELYGEGTYTEQGYNLYIFTILTEDATTIQYYIVGDMEHVLVHVTDFHDERITDIEDVAQSICDSFKWQEEISGTE